MDVTKTHHIDRSPQGEDGRRDYCYDYDLYTFAEGNTSLVVRKYIDGKSVQILRKQKHGSQECLSVADLNAPLTLKVIEYFKQEGIEEIEYLASSGYKTIYRIA